MVKTADDLLTRLFRASMWWRIFYGLLRLLFGLALLKAVGTPLIDLTAKLMHHELVTDPSDILFLTASQILSQHPFYVTYFLAFYFIFWGIVDVVLSINLLKERLWAFPVSICLIVGFIFYEIFRVSHTHSAILLWVIFIDTLILIIVSREYQKILDSRN